MNDYNVAEAAEYELKWIESHLEAMFIALLSKIGKHPKTWVKYHPPAWTLQIRFKSLAWCRMPQLFDMRMHWIMYAH